jgi:small GTP-binding protein
MSTISKKICLVGDFGVGKTSLIRRFVDRQFSDQYLSTVGVKISRKTVELAEVRQQEKLDLQMLIWDVEGSTKFKSIAPTYLQGAKGAIIVADVTRLETIDRIAEHIDFFLSINPTGYAIVALNKSDLIEAEKLADLIQTFQTQQLQRLKDPQRAIAVWATSAKTGTSVDQIFLTLATKMVELA